MINKKYFAHFARDANATEFFCKDINMREFREYIREWQGANRLPNYTECWINKGI